MSRTNSHQRTWKFYALDKQLRTEVLGPTRQPLFNEQAWTDYKLAFSQVIQHQEGFSTYEIINKISNRHGNKRHMEARVKLKKKRIEKRSTRQKVRSFIEESIIDENFDAIL